MSWTNPDRDGHYWLAASPDPECDEANCKGCGLWIYDYRVGMACPKPHARIDGEVVRITEPDPAPPHGLERPVLVPGDVHEGYCRHDMDPATCSTCRGTDRGL